ncbi:MAG: NFACT RNA binding domain-containing protein [Bacteroidota bacterium]
MDFYTLLALAAEWDRLLAGARIDDAWTQSPRELSLSLGDGGHTVRVVCESPQTLLFRSAGGGRQRRNTADVLGGLAGRTVECVRTAERDRHLFWDLDDGSRLQVVLFGSRPNVLWVQDDAVRAAFLDEAEWEVQPPPEPRPAPHVETADAFAARWRSDRKTVAQAVASAAPLFTRTLATEAVCRAGLDPDALPTGADTPQLFEAVQAYEAVLLDPEPHVYWRGRVAEAFALVPLAAAPAEWRAEAFDSVDAALGVWAKRQLAQRAYTDGYRPLDKALAAAYGRRQRSAEAMLSELSQPSRADRYETWGHLLMASGNAPAGRESVTLDDIISGGDPVEIPLDPALTAVENAERFYDKARRTRRARESAEARWESVSAEAEQTGDLLAALRATETVADLRAFQETHGDAVDAIVGQRSTEGPAEPFRRIALPAGFEALVGKNARGNAHLTTRVASPHDLWLHARGVPGSHVVVKRPGRDSEVPPHTVAAAARLAAWFSTARTQSVVPVTVTERKYVRPIKGGPPGLVRVDREDVIDVTPQAP